MSETLRTAPPAGASRSVATRAPYKLFEVTGLELEYAVVDRALNPQCLVEDAFRVLHGRPTSDVSLQDVGFSNELAAHVFELKTLDPVTDLRAAEAALVDGMRRFSAVLSEHFDARLLPTAMHPFMKPADTHLWQRSGRAIYETYAKLFSIHEHGWLNVQSSQINLPFGTEAETAALHNATACVLPYLPALAASSPIVEGQPGPSICNRMAFYAQNQRTIPEITGRVVPEYMTSFEQYRSDIFEPIYKALDRIEGAERIRHEFVNSRGAILRFDRSAIEIRVVDLQECVRMDVAIATFARLAIKELVRDLQSGDLSLPPHAALVADYDACVAQGRQARVMAPHLVSSATTAESALLYLLERARAASGPAEETYLRLVESRIRRGNLAELILRETGLDQRAGTVGRDAIERVYDELADSLQRNEPWQP
jgi:carboxylate-amine ligase